MNNNEIKIFQTQDGSTEFSVLLNSETVWLNLNQMSELFERDKSVISRHIRNIFLENELDKNSVVAFFATTGTDGKNYNVEYFNLDVIISIGYRVKSKRGTQFRIWANKVLKEYLIKGYTLNNWILEQKNELYIDLQKSLNIISNALKLKELENTESIGLLKIISEYAYGLQILDQYDHQNLTIQNTSNSTIFQLTYDDAIYQISIAKKAQGNSELFGREKDQSFQSSISTIYQTIDGNELYPSLEEKAANLLYFITKNHSFSDGNKRIAALIFLYFLEKNLALYKLNGDKRLADNTLVALTLMIAVSKPEEKETMIKVIVNLINSNN
jgi:prophage maintenance system killer protein